MRTQPNQNPTFAQQFATAKWLMQFPALTLMVFLRRDIGFRLLRVGVLLAVFGLLAVAAILAMPGSDEATRPVALLIFAALGFLNGIAQRIQRWRDMERNVRQHSYYVGTSAFANQRWLPAFFRRHRRAARLLDPLLCTVIGLALLPVSRALGTWIVFSSFCLRAHEDGIFHREHTQILDVGDSMIESDVQGETVEHFSEPVTADQNQSASAGVPTGIGDDIHEQISKQKNKKSNQP